MRRVLVATLLLAVSACHSSGKPAATKAPPATATTTTASKAVTTTTTAAQTSGIRTVLSPIGLNIRAQPLKTAPIVRTAAQGTMLTVLGHSADGGGWYQVKGTTVTGWISDNATLSGAGQFGSYTSAVHMLSTLYPATWTYAEAPPVSVVFRAPAAGPTVVMTTAATVAALGRGRAGYIQTKDEPIVVCGVTSDLVTYMQVTTPPTTTPPPGGVPTGHYLAQVNLTLDATHALGINGNLADLSQMPPVRDIINSVSFPFPRCQA